MPATDASRSLCRCHRPRNEEIGHLSEVLTRASVVVGSSGAAGLTRSRQSTPRSAVPSKARCWWTDRTAAEPSPTAAATRFVDRERKSPTAKRPGWLVSKGRGSLPSVFQASSISSGARARSVSTKASSSRAARPESQADEGSAPMNENSPAHSTVNSPSGPLRCRACNASPPSRRPQSSAFAR